jgi:hypothetical protein
MHSVRSLFAKARGCFSRPIYSNLIRLVNLGILTNSRIVLRPLFAPCSCRAVYSQASNRVQSSVYALRLRQREI